jgi:hypothetical protein
MSDGLWARIAILIVHEVQRLKRFGFLAGHEP